MFGGRFIHVIKQPRPLTERYKALFVVQGHNDTGTNLSYIHHVL